MLQTDHFIRFEHVSSVEQTERGLLARVHLEELRIDLVRDDVVRMKMSRGGVFDEAPTHAVYVDPLTERVDFRFERDDECVRLKTSDLVVSLWLDPFRIDVHRPDGTPVIETAADDVTAGTSAGSCVLHAITADIGIYGQVARLEEQARS